MLSNFHYDLDSKKYVIEFTIGEAICIRRVMTLAQVDLILDRRGWFVPPPSPLSVVDQKSPGQIGLRVPVIKSRDQTNMRKNISALIRFLINPNSCFTETHLKKPHRNM